MHVLDSMVKRGVMVGAISFSNLIKCCLAHGAVREGKRVLHHIFSNGYHAKTVFTNSLVNMYRVKGDLSQTAAFLDNERGVRHSDGDEALCLYMSMRIEGFLADQSTLMSVLRACTSLSLLELGRQTHVHVLKFDQDLILNNALLDMLARQNVDLATYAAKEIIKLDPQDTGAYVLLSNIYAISKRWNDVAEVRRAMKKQGIRKEPGCCWIEVNKQIRAFILGDKSHPQIDEINRQLNQFICRLASAGYVPDTMLCYKILDRNRKKTLFDSTVRSWQFFLMGSAPVVTIGSRKEARKTETESMSLFKAAFLTLQSADMYRRIKLVTIALLLVNMSDRLIETNAKMILIAYDLPWDWELWLNLTAVGVLEKGKGNVRLSR
ncbi:hypothetical protein VNO78_11406 [Psophocarpus tetragonolobus]|uniref:Pentatricopeptide repeat-containing protein n=1 Tax=Psophocarpus tetragonolobus TaxID=3891 RepID=A0AAN9SP67_PSOTE